VADPIVDRVTLTRAPLSQKPTIANLLQFYLHDFSEFSEVGTEHGEVGADGRFPYEYLDAYWQEDKRCPFTICADGRLAGFVLINQWSALDRPLDRSVAEFFILRKYRRYRVGRRAAGLLVQRFPGRWEVPVAWYNRPALAFWRATVPALADGPVEERVGDGRRWAGIVLAFTKLPGTRGCGEPR
jgi:predicted acetyltransferase